MKHYKLTVFIFLISLFPVRAFTAGPEDKNPYNQSPVFNVSEPGVSNPYLEEWYFRTWYEPYGYFTPEMRNRLAAELNELPQPDAVNNWVLWGPIGQNLWSNPGQYYSGRILDIEVDNGVSTRIASASGGVWGFFLFFPIALSDNILSTLNIGSFDSKPGDANTILVGTGEGAYNNGSGLFMTTNGGGSYTQITMTPTPAAFFKIRYAPGNTSIVHAACNTGYYRSTDGGSSWTRIQLTQRVTDLAIDPSNINVLYAPVWGDGLYKSVNGGTSWTKLTAGGIPTANFGRSSISLCNASPGTVYVNVSRNDNDLTLGVYKTINGGTSWTNVTPAAEFHAYGWYNNACGVSPTNANRVVVGGLTLWRSTNGGSSWTEITNAHADQHSVTWSTSGGACWVGNDGGFIYSGDAGITWDHQGFLPITQYVIFDVTPDGNYCYGGSQDNGLSGTSNRGVNWYHFLGGDGGGAAIDPANHNIIYMTNGVYGGSWAFRRLRTTNSGQSWSLIDAGIDPSNEWYHRIRSDKVPAIWLYNNSGPYVWESTNSGSSWSRLNGTAFSGNIGNLSVSIYTSPKAVIYACISSGANKLQVYDNTGFFERSAGMPSNRVRHVSPHPTNNNKAAALMNGFSAGNKIYWTSNRGLTWINKTGNLPDVLLSDIVLHPSDDNKMYLGTQMGCYRTTDGGASWHRWNNGMANATQVSEMGYIDSIAANGRFYVVAATYGRSIYYREISGDDPIGITENQNQVPSRYELKQNYPNPFNPTTTIEFGLPVDDNVRLEVFDIIGRHVATLIDEKIKAGNHSVKFDGKNLSSGIYFYRLTTAKMVDTKRMMLVK